jgi:hypothetical protein
VDTLLAIGLAIISILGSWCFTRRYYLQSLRNQNNEYSKQISQFLDLQTENHNIQLLQQKQQYIDSAVSEWQKRGTPVRYIDSLPHLSQKEKSEIYQLASLRHKGREPKNNPYT